jgi:hypothetical protein
MIAAALRAFIRGLESSRISISNFLEQDREALLKKLDNEIENDKLFGAFKGWRLSKWSKMLLDAQGNSSIRRD